jgi:hypothetical protein
LRKIKKKLVKLQNHRAKKKLKKLNKKARNERQKREILI